MTAGMPAHILRWVPRVTELLEGEGPIVAVTDFMKAIPDQIARWVPEGRSRSAPA